MCVAISGKNNSNSKVGLEFHLLMFLTYFSKDKTQDDEGGKSKPSTRQGDQDMEKKEPQKSNRKKKSGVKARDVEMSWPQNRLTQENTTNHTLCEVEQI